MLSQVLQSPTAGLRRPPNYPRSVTKTTRLTPGNKAPAFLPDADSSNVSLADLQRTPRHRVLLPGDATPGCTKQACDFRDNLGDSPLPASAFDLVSPRQARLATFRDAQGLTFPLLSDPDRGVLAAYRVPRGETDVWQDGCGSDPVHPAGRR